MVFLLVNFTLFVGSFFVLFFVGFVQFNAPVADVIASDFLRSLIGAGAESHTLVSQVPLKVLQVLFVQVCKLS